MAENKSRRQSDVGHRGYPLASTHTQLNLSHSHPLKTVEVTSSHHNPSPICFQNNGSSQKQTSKSDTGHQRVNFLDKFRLRNSSPRLLLKKVGNKSRSLLSSPTNNAEFSPYSNTSPGINSDIIFRNFNTTRDDDNDSGSSISSKPNKKWYSFTNLLSKSNFKGFLAIPRSRLSVSSIFTSESDVTTTTVTPSEFPDFGFPNFSDLNRNNQPSSPSPSCVTVPGDFSVPSSRGSSTVVFRRPRYNQRRSVSISASPGIGAETIPESSIGSRNRIPAYRISCGEFYPGGGAPSSPGFLGLDFQFHSYNRNGQGKSSPSDGISQSKRALVRSLPTLLEAMESSKLEGSGEEVSGDGNYTGTIESVTELLYQEFVILTGSKTLDDHYILIFPDRGNFHQLGDDEYRVLVKYLVSIPLTEDAESGFVLLIDRRNDKWNSVKTTLLRISTYFPGVIQRVFVLRPSGFLQKALSEVSSKLFRNENLRFRLTVCNNVTDLVSFIDPGQLPLELGGTLLYDKIQWVQERIEVESFHSVLQNLSRDLKVFTESFVDFEYPNDVSSTQDLIQKKLGEFSHLKSSLTQGGDHGENILKRIKNLKGNGEISQKSAVQLVNVILLERFILQIEETGNLFQEFWDKEKSGLERCLQLRKFEQDFRELQISFDLHVKCLNGIPEMGESVNSTDGIILETLHYQDMTKEDLTRALQLEVIGREIVSTNPTATDTVEPKCLELSRMASHFRFILQEKLTKQKQWREVQTTIEKANELCTEGMDLLNSQQLAESTDDSPDWNGLKYTMDILGDKIQLQVDELMVLKTSLTLVTASQAKTLVKQVLRRVEEVQNMVQKRQTILVQYLEKKQNLPFSCFKTRRSSGSFFDTKSFGKGEDSSDGSSFSSFTKTSISSTNSFESNGKSFDDVDRGKQIKRCHVLQELLQTEQTYVEEIGLILTGYRDQALNPDIQSILPTQLAQNNSDRSKSRSNVTILFCNLDEIYSFHSKIFLPDLTNCIESIELVALCFIQRHSDFLAMYSEYCQLKGSSDSLLKEIGENHAWLSWCQEKLGHRLSLSSYLLKPVQRITKYHLLLGSLMKYSEMCDGYSELLEALDCMVVVVRSVNDGMHQLQIRGYSAKLSAEGPLLLQGQFTVWMETMKNRLRLKGHQRYLFLYQKSILVCKKTGQQSSLIYEFKNKVNLCEVGITEDPKGSGASKKFEIWIQGRQKVFLFQASSKEVKIIWVNEIKKLLMEQLQYLREAKGSSLPNPNQSGSSVKRSRLLVKGTTLNGYRTPQIGSSHLPVRQSSSYDQSDGRKSRGIDTDVEEDIWSSGISNSEDESEASQVLSLPHGSHKSRHRSLNKSGSSSSMGSSLYGVGENVENGPKYVVTNNFSPDTAFEIPLIVGDVVELIKTGCGGWWFVRRSDGSEGWAPKGYLEKILPCIISPLCSSISSQSVSVSVSDRGSTQAQAQFSNSKLQKQSSIPCLPTQQWENGSNKTPDFEYEASVLLQLCNELGSQPKLN